MDLDINLCTKNECQAVGKQLTGGDGKNPISVIKALKKAMNASEIISFKASNDSISSFEQSNSITTSNFDAKIFTISLSVNSLTLSWEFMIVVVLSKL